MHRLTIDAVPIRSLEFSPDGTRVAVSAFNKVFVWSVDSGQLTHTIVGTSESRSMRVARQSDPGRSLQDARPRGHVDTAFAWLANGQRIVFEASGQLGVLDLETGDEVWSRRDQVFLGIAVSPLGDRIAAGTAAGVILILMAHDGTVLRTLSDHSGAVYEFAWSPDGRHLAAGGSSDGPWRGIDGHETTIRIWDTGSGNFVARLAGHTGDITGLAWSPRSTMLASVSMDKSVRLWEPLSGRLITIVEVHTDVTRGLAFSPDGSVLASTSWDGTVRFWRPDEVREVALLRLSPRRDMVWSPISFTADGGHFAMARADELLIFRTDVAAIAQGGTALDTVRYTTARLVLVGDSGVGKTGLGWRLSHGEFREHASTHGQQFWAVDSLGVVRPDGTECEAVIWDLAGQHVYRPVHVIFLERVDLALVMFDPTNRHDTLKGVDFWLEQLAGKGTLPPTVLIGARLDRGSSVLSRADLAELCRNHGISGGYIGTSAKTGEGVDELTAVLRQLIPWENTAATVTTVTFKRIKDYVLALKEESATGRVLVDMDQLFRELCAFDPEWRFTLQEMRTAVGHLETHGYVAVMRSSAGLELVLLVPSLLPDLASSIILQADRHPRELGALSESVLLRGDYPFTELAALEPTEREVLIDATVERFLRHTVCFRVTLGAETLLIFPSLIRQRRPLQDDAETIDDVSYIARGRVENSYAALAVLLGYAPVFTRVTQWQDQTHYEIEKGQICGLRVIQEREGELEFVLSYSSATPPFGRALFQGLFEKFLTQRDVKATRFTPVLCRGGHRQERSVVVQRRRERRGFLYCSECGEKVVLPDANPVGTPDAGMLVPVIRQEGYARLRSEYEANLARVKAYSRTAATPRCYLSRAGDQERWAEDLVQSIRDAGVELVEHPDGLSAGDVVLMVLTPSYWSAWSQPSGPIARDLPVLAARLRRGSTEPIIPMLVEGNPDSDQLARLGGRDPLDFREESRHFLRLFDLVLSLHGIRATNPAFAPLRRDLANRRLEALSAMRDLRRSPAAANPRDVFVSYAWNDESKTVVAELNQAFAEQGVRMIQDTKDLAFRGDIRAFMRAIGQGQAVVLVISDKYLRSENCMFELLEVEQHGDLRDRIFPVVLDSARIYKPLDRIEYVRFWEEQIATLDTALKTVSAANLDGFREEIDLYTAIRAALPRLGDVLKNLNALTPALHRDSGYAQVVEAVLRTLDT
ncbi:TIR domain-containing protein [Catellatospora tritici]|uniref:TIR domain-containing protein n=1 Tax=Catellatospora tritici TaxID=2851566 RepID=UPI001C2D022D|nr:TIR domain-containing protein [Catellatospora tritici]MBV1849966.1 TIR domain-containing protein [Catellatospora tritici]